MPVESVSLPPGAGACLPAGSLPADSLYVVNVIDLLRTMDIFENLPEGDLEAIANILRERRLARDEVLFRQGDAGDAMYIVTGGRIRLSASDVPGPHATLAQLTDGQFFGEMALLTGTPRSTTAAAEMDSVLLVLEREDFDHLLAGNAQIMREMLKVVSQRTVQTNQQLLADGSSSATFSGAGRVVAVFSPRGGSGKTTIAVNLATVLSRYMPERVALLDLSLTFPSAGALFGLAPTVSLAQVPVESLEMMDRRMLAQYVVRHDSGAHLLAGALRAEEGESVTAEHVRAVLRVMKRQFSLTVIDCAANFSDATLAAVEAADRLLLVCTPELTSIRDVRECQRLFTEVVHVEKSRIAYVLNHHQPFKMLTRAQFEAALEQPLGMEIPHAGEAVARAALRGQPLAASGDGPFVRAVQRLAFELSPVDARDERGKAQHRSLATASDHPARRSRGLLSLLKRT